MTVIYEHPLTEHAKLLYKIEVTYSKIKSLLNTRNGLFFQYNVFNY